MFRPEHAGLAVEAVDRSPDVGLALQHARVVHQVPGGEVVGAVDNQVVLREDLHRVVGIEALLVQHHGDIRVEFPDGVARRLRLRAAHVRLAVDDLPLQVRFVDDIEVDDAERAHPGSGQVQQGGGAEPASTHAEHPGVLQALLPGHSDLRDDQVARIALDLVNGQLCGRRDQRWQRHGVVSWKGLPQRRHLGLSSRLGRGSRVSHEVNQREPPGIPCSPAGPVLTERRELAPEMSPAPGTTQDMPEPAPPGGPMPPPPPGAPGESRARASGSARRLVLPLVPGLDRPPARKRPLPDAAAVRLVVVPDSAPPYDDERVAVAYDNSRAAVGGDTPTNPHRLTPPPPPPPLPRTSPAGASNSPARASNSPAGAAAASAGQGPP